MNEAIIKATEMMCDTAIKIQAIEQISNIIFLCMLLSFLCLLIYKISKGEI